MIFVSTNPLFLKECKFFVCCELAMCADEEYLALSGIQHFAFCRRQWGLIHIEQVWQENLLTSLGRVVHSRAHDASERERRGDVLIVRNLYVSSSVLRLEGRCDVVEFFRSDEGCPLFGEDGLWSVRPVEYKRGSSKNHDADRLQLCAQAMCLEEMLSCEIGQGDLYYGASRHRETVVFADGLRESVTACAKEMHALYARRYVPRVKKKESCRSCSLNDICYAEILDRSVKEYISDYVGHGDETSS